MRRKDREVTDPQIIRDVFTRADVCRLAFVDGRAAYIVALNFGVEFDETLGAPRRLFFHSAPKGKKIDLAKECSQNNAPVCFQIDLDHTLRPDDIACNWSMNYKSVVGYGKIRFLDDVAEKQRALDCLMDHYPVKPQIQPETKSPGAYEYTEKDFKITTVMELAIDSFTCKMRNA